MIDDGGFQHYAQARNRWTCQTSYEGGHAEPEEQAKALQTKADEMQALAARLAAGQAVLPAQVAAPGDIVWARETGYPFWPSVVLTQQEAAACPAFGDKSAPDFWPCTLHRSLHAACAGYMFFMAGS